MPEGGLLPAIRTKGWSAMVDSDACVFVALANAGAFVLWVSTMDSAQPPNAKHVKNMSKA